MNSTKNLKLVMSKKTLNTLNKNHKIYKSTSYLTELNGNKFNSKRSFIKLNPTISQFNKIRNEKENENDKECVEYKKFVGNREIREDSDKIILEDYTFKATLIEFNKDDKGNKENIIDLGIPHQIPSIKVDIFGKPTNNPLLKSKISTVKNSNSCFTNAFLNTFQFTKTKNLNKYKVENKNAIYDTGHFKMPLISKQESKTTMNKNSNLLFL